MRFGPHEGGFGLARLGLLAAAREVQRKVIEDVLNGDIARVVHIRVRVAAEVRLQEVEESREQGERAARQSVFNAMSFLFGHQTEAALGCAILRPNPDGRTLDITLVNGQIGLRRLREGEAMTVFGIRSYPLGEAGAASLFHTTLDGRSIEDASRVLDEFCVPRAPELKLVRSNEQRLFVLPAGTPNLDDGLHGVILGRTWAQ